MMSLGLFKDFLLSFLWSEFILIKFQLQTILSLPLGMPTAMQQMCCPIGIEIPNAAHDGLQEMIEIPNPIDPSSVGGNEINAAKPLKAITLFSAK